MLKAVISVTVLGVLSCSSAIGHELRDVDLAIGDTSSWGRPAILVAWRNTFKVFEAEILVKNYGKDIGHGKVSLEIVDAAGHALIRRPEVGAEKLVTVPGRDEGGLEGKIVQIIGSKKANQLLDRLDREKAVYSIRARVDTVEADVAPLNNIAAKTYNNELRLQAGQTIQFNYLIPNSESFARHLRHVIETTALPERWRLAASTPSGTDLSMKPGELKQAFVRLSRPNDDMHDNVRVGVRLKTVDEELQKTVDLKEWFVASDSEPPEFQTKEDVIEVNNGIVHIEVVAFDGASGIKEASGVTVEYSTDDELSFSNKIMSYLDGNFIKPTRFLAELGPFRKGTTVQLAVTATDTVGNITRRSLKPVTIE